MGVTEKCNFRCIMCDMWKNRPCAEELNLSEKMQILEQLKAAIGRFSVTFYGGEPTLKFNELLELCRYCASNGIESGFNTNGSLLTRPRIDHLLSAGVDRITISLDAIAAEVHDSIRGIQGAHDRAFNALKHLAEARICNPNFTLAVASVLMQKNIDDIVDVARFCKVNNIEWTYQNVLGKFAFGGGPYEPAWAEKDQNIIRDLEKLKRTLEDLNKLGVNRNKLTASKKYFLSPHDSRKCVAGLTNLVIDCCGGLRLCYLMKPFGTWKDPIIPFWKKSDKAKSQRKESLTCRLPCSGADCNIYRSTLTKIKDGVNKRFL